MYPGTHARLTPDKPAVIMADTGVTVTYRELDERSNQFAHLLREMGLVRGDTIALVMENHPRFLEISWAAQRSGLYYTPINWHLTPDEMAYVIQDSGSRVVFTTLRHAETAQAMVKDVEDVRIIVVDDEAAGPDASTLLAGQPVTALEDESEGFGMIYSSGTTGRPKGGKQPLPTWHPKDAPGAVLGLLPLFGMDAHSVYLSPGAPMYHAAPLRMAIPTHRLGGTVVIMDRFDPLKALSYIEKHQVTVSQWVPTMFVRMLRLSDEEKHRYDLSSHQAAVHSAAPCPVSVKQAMMDWWGPIIHEYYGGSEGGAFTYITPHQWLEHPGSVGKAFVGTIHILDDDENELPPGQSGGVYSSDRPVAYHNDPVKTAKAHSRQGWTTVGDIGYLDEEGYLFLTDRKNDVMIIGGVNIYPQETENVLIQHPAVADVAVFGIPNEEFGEEIKAAVQLADPSQASPELAEELIAFSQERMSKQKCPRSIDFVEQFPRTPSGKLYKRRLRDPYWAGRTTAIS